jgi:hypothetical protein
MKRRIEAAECPPVIAATNQNRKKQTAFPDTLSEKGAMALARRLQRHWHDRGYPAVRFWASPIEERFSKVGTYEFYRVECNLVNGLPPRYRDDAVKR